MDRFSEASCALAKKLSVPVASLQDLELDDNMPPLGRGAFAICTKGRYRPCGEEVRQKKERETRRTTTIAVKRYENDEGGNNKALFVRELRSLARLREMSHPSLCELLAVVPFSPPRFLSDLAFADDDNGKEKPSTSRKRRPPLPGIAMSLFVGIPLSAWVKNSADGRRSRTEEDVRSVAVQLLSVVDHLHSKARMVHGDISMSNILVNGTDVKLVDFGNARHLPPKDELGCIGSDANVAQPKYSSPEALCHFRCCPLPRCDFCTDFDPELAETHALGVVLLSVAEGWSTCGLWKEAKEENIGRDNGGYGYDCHGNRGRSSCEGLADDRYLSAAASLVFFWGKSKTLRFWKEWKQTVIWSKKRTRILWTSGKGCNSDKNNAGMEGKNSLVDEVPTTRKKETEKTTDPESCFEAAAFKYRPHAPKNDIAKLVLRLMQPLPRQRLRAGELLEKITVCGRKREAARTCRQ